MIAKALRCAKINSMKTRKNLISENELFELIRTHQAILKLEYDIEMYLENHDSILFLLSISENLQALSDTLNKIILQHPFWDKI